MKPKGLISRESSAVYAVAALMIASCAALSASHVANPLGPLVLLAMTMAMFAALVTHALTDSKRSCFAVIVLASFTIPVGYGIFVTVFVVDLIRSFL